MNLIVHFEILSDQETSNAILLRWRKQSFGLTRILTNGKNRYETSMVLATLIVFLVSLLIGALAIYIGARIVVGVDNYTYAIGTALIAAIVWAIVALFVGWIPIVGPLLVFIAYLAVIKWRYPGGWISAIAITLIAWLSGIIILMILGALGIVPFDAIGVPLE